MFQHELSKTSFLPFSCTLFMLVYSRILFINHMRKFSRVCHVLFN